MFMLVRDVLTLYEFKGKCPKIGKNSYVFPTADLIGDVEIGEGCYVGPGARLRADCGSVRVGNHTNIQDNCVFHTRTGENCIIGNGVTIGHGAIIHGAKIEDKAVIGMGAIISDYAVVGEGAVIAEGAVVKNRTNVPKRKVMAGVPAGVVSDVSQELYDFWISSSKMYEDLAVFLCSRGLKRIEFQSDAT
jgi:carbonic anhydrase/acetyltransferase-like protein (isoleucine patch superfamily)